MISHFIWENEFICLSPYYTYVWESSHADLPSVKSASPEALIASARLPPWATILRRSTLPSRPFWAEPTQLVRQTVHQPCRSFQKILCQNQVRILRAFPSKQRCLQTATPPLHLQMGASPPSLIVAVLKITTLLLDKWVIARERHLYKYWLYEYLKLVKSKKCKESEFKVKCEKYQIKYQFQNISVKV